MKILGKVDVTKIEVATNTKKQKEELPMEVKELFKRAKRLRISNYKALYANGLLEQKIDEVEELYRKARKLHIADYKDLYVNGVLEQEMEEVLERKRIKEEERKARKLEKLRIKKQSQEKYAKELNIIKEHVKAELGVSFDSAVMMFTTMNPDKKMSVDDYANLPDFWKFAEKLADVDVMHSGISVHKIAEACRKYYFAEMHPSEIQAMTEEEALIFIQNIKTFYDNANRTPSKPKATYSIIKMNLNDINADGTFDSRNALDLTGSEIKESTNTMRRVLTAEDGIYRYIKDIQGKHYDDAYKHCLNLGYSHEQARYEAMGLNMVSIDYNLDSNDEIASEQIKIKDYINRNGLVDVATGDVYYFLKCTPSESRKGTVTFICQNEGNGWQETFEWWYTFTGTRNFHRFAQALGKPVPGTQNSWSMKMYLKEGLPHETFEGYCERTDKPITEYKFNISKMMTRLASQGSNTYNSQKLMDEESYKALRQTNVLIVPDREIKLHRKFKTLNEDSTDLVEMEDIVKLVAGDGQGLGSPEFHARVTLMKGAITQAEHDYYIQKLHEYNDDIQIAGKKDSKFRKIQLKIFSVIQGRGGMDTFLSFKGIFVMVDFKKFVIKLTEKLAKQLNKLNGTNFKAGDILPLKDYDVICPQSVAKFILVDGEKHEFKWDVCNHSKKKGEWVCMNPQFIASLSPVNPNLFTPILEFWSNYVKKAFDDTATMLHLLNIISNSGEDTETVNSDNIIDDENETADSADIATMITANGNWKSDPYILSRIEDTIRKFMNEMAVGRVRVPGVYTYMVQDPYKLLQMYFNIPNMQYSLKKGQFYFNNKKCRAGLFRSPLVAPFQAQRVQLVENNYYWFYRDVIIFNAVDGVWELMGGADFDGDTCAVVPEDDSNGFGKLIVEAIRQNQMMVYAPKRGAKEVIWNPDNYEEIIRYLNNIGRDNTGVFTNYATRLLALSNHLYGLVDMARRYNAEKIEFLHPEKTWGRQNNFGVDYPFGIDGDKLVTRAIVPCAWNMDLKKFEFADEQGILGVYNLEEVEALAEGKTVREVNMMAIIQMEEIDGAKTGYRPEVPDDCVYTQNPAWLIARQKFLGRLPLKYELDKHGNPNYEKPVQEPEKFSVTGLFSTLDTTKTKLFNSYRSFDIMGRIYEFVYKERTEIFKRFSQGTDKISYLKGLMSDEERNQLSMKLMAGEKRFTLLEHLKERKKEYNTNIRNLKNISIDESSEKLTLANLKYKEIKYLKLLSASCKVSMEVLAYGCYLAAYDKNDHQNEGLSYAWILWPELASISSRGNASFELLALPNNAEEAFILSNVLFVNGKRFLNVKAEDGVVSIQRFGGNKAFALIHKVNGASVVERVSRISAGAQYEIGVYGFGYANRECKTVQEWKDRIKANGFQFHIVDDGQGSLCTAIIDDDGTKHILAQVRFENRGENDTDLDLKDKKVMAIKGSNYKDTDKYGYPAKSISGLRVLVM